MEKITAAKINEEIKNNAQEFIKKCEDDYSNQITNLAASICDRAVSHPIIFLSGPSGAGKTTTALRLDSMLDSFGHPTHTLSLDDYFLPHQDDLSDGEIDFESPERLDIEFLRSQLLSIANCEEVMLPGFDFKTQQRVDKRKFKRKKDELVVVEGIHALNPLVTGEREHFSSKIYVSVRTRIINDEGVSFHPSMIRLIRRLVRDTQFRGRKPEDVFRQFKSVERGENLYIMPYKERSHFEVDTFFPYELCVYRNFLLPKLYGIKESYSDYYKFSSVEKMLSDIEPLGEEYVPKNSLVREFFGGSELEY